MVMAVCRGLVGPCGDDDDAFQATFLVLLNRIGTFPVGQSLGGWLYQVARRVARQARVSHVRRRRRESAAEPRAGSAAECDPERSETLDVIRQEVDRLPERYRAPIVLCDLEGLSRDEAAALLGCPAGTVGGRLARARRQLRDQLQAQGCGPLDCIPTSARVHSRRPHWRTSLEAATRAAAALPRGTWRRPRLSRSWRYFIRGTTVVLVMPAIALALVACLAVGLVAARHAPEPPVVPANQPRRRGKFAHEAPRRSSSRPRPRRPEARRPIRWTSDRARRPAAGGRPLVHRSAQFHCRDARSNTNPERALTVGSSSTPPT